MLTEMYGTSIYSSIWQTETDDGDEKIFGLDMGIQKSFYIFTVKLARNPSNYFQQCFQFPSFDFNVWEIFLSICWWHWGS